MFSDIISIHTIVDYNILISHVICKTHFVMSCTMYVMI